MLDLEIIIRAQGGNQIKVPKILRKYCLTISTFVKISFKGCMLLLVSVEHIDISPIIGKGSSYQCNDPLPILFCMVGRDGKTLLTII